MKKLAKILLTLAFAFMGTVSQAQDEIQMADTMRSNGSIYVVVGIILVVLAGFIIYLFMLDRKISKLEKEIKRRE